MKKPAKFLILPGDAQPRRSSGAKQPWRIFLADGTELPTVNAIICETENSSVLLGKVPSVSGPHRITLEFYDASYEVVSTVPRKAGGR